MDAKNIVKLFYDNQDLKYRDFSIKLGGTELDYIGVRVPILKSIVKDHYKDEDLDLSSFELDKYFEVNFFYIMVSFLREKTFDDKMNFLMKDGLKHATAWALTDTIPNYVKKTPDINVFKKYFAFFIKNPNPFTRRFAYVFANKYRQDSKCLYFLDNMVDDDSYYVYMAEAWLIADIAITYPNEVYDYLVKSCPNKKLKQKAISKMCDSFRITAEWKEKYKELRK